MSERPLKERMGQPLLPDTYAVDRVTGIAVSPRKLAWHWELSGPARSLIDARQRGRTVLRLVPAAAGSATRDVAILEGIAGRGYTEVLPGRTVSLRVVWVPEEGGERSLSESEPVRVPWERPDDFPPSESVRSTGTQLHPVAGDSPRGAPTWSPGDGS